MKITASAIARGPFFILLFLKYCGIPDKSHTVSRVTLSCARGSKINVVALGR